MGPGDCDIGTRDGLEFGVADGLELRTANDEVLNIITL